MISDTNRSNTGSIRVDNGCLSMSYAWLIVELQVHVGEGARTVGHGAIPVPAASPVKDKDKDFSSHNYQFLS